MTLGTIGCGQPGTVGDNFRQLYADPNIDVVEAHDYLYPNDALSACMSSAFAAATALNKPFFIGEAGIDLTQSGISRQARGPLMRAKMLKGAQMGFAGYLLWGYSDHDEATFGFTNTDNDPLPAVLKDMTTTWK